ncbi:hypothetical protein SAMN06272737_14515 [Blastococcus mobilis]|uniref:Uncharacterized protein n=1 Tax=Blastococcus mobilis TaxID=1938746 RepID=A0A239AHF7_9ACTN|nr:hypothetical protein SAMN06272737_14515 [Blastococcus mobilis]
MRFPRRLRTRPVLALLQGLTGKPVVEGPPPPPASSSSLYLVVDMTGSQVDATASRHHWECPAFLIAVEAFVESWAKWSAFVRLWTQWRTRHDDDPEDGADGGQAMPRPPNGPRGPLPPPVGADSRGQVRPSGGGRSGPATPWWSVDSRLSARAVRQHRLEGHPCSPSSWERRRLPQSWPAAAERAPAQERRLVAWALTVAIACVELSWWHRALWQVELAAATATERLELLVLTRPVAIRGSRELREPWRANALAAERVRTQRMRQHTAMDAPVQLPAVSASADHGDGRGFADADTAAECADFALEGLRRLGRTGAGSRVPGAHFPTAGVANNLRRRRWHRALRWFAGSRLHAWTTRRLLLRAPAESRGAIPAQQDGGLPATRSLSLTGSHLKADDHHLTRHWEGSESGICQIERRQDEGAGPHRGGGDVSQRAA